MPRHGSRLIPLYSWWRNYLKNLHELIAATRSEEWILLVNMCNIYTFFATLTGTGIRPFEGKRLVWDDIIKLPPFVLLRILGKTDPYFYPQRRLVPAVPTLINLLDELRRINNAILSSYLRQPLTPSLPTFFLIEPSPEGPLLVPISDFRIDRILAKYKKRLGNFPREHNFPRHLVNSLMKKKGWTYQERCLILGQTTQWGIQTHSFSLVDSNLIFKKFCNLSEKIYAEFRIENLFSIPEIALIVK